MGDQKPLGVKRYHRNFIGLMEQSNAGEWVSHSDYDGLRECCDKLREVLMRSKASKLGLDQDLEALKKENVRLKTYTAKVEKLLLIALYLSVLAVVWYANYG